MNKLKALLLSCLLLGLSACGGGAPVTYAPAAYGVAGQCFYLNSPAEVYALQAAGLCPHTWLPTLMPYYWHNQYYAYYASPNYYNRYVPVSSRTVYVQRQQSYYKANTATILKAEPAAKYKGSNGKIVTGQKIGVTKYGGGVRTNTKFGGGSSKCGLGPAMHIEVDGYGGGGSRGGSTGGGGSRAGSGGGGSRIGSGGGSVPKPNSGGGNVVKPKSGGNAPKIGGC